ncbi:MAG: hypothetical protein EZS28_047893, partial [Streblomastix strix]
ITEKKPYPSLIRLLNHSDFVVIRRSIASINNILLGGSYSSSFNQPHPHFQAVASCGGINKLYSLFKKNEFEKITILSALCIGQLFEAKEISNVTMRIDVVTYFKAEFAGFDELNKKSAKYVLGLLAKNSVNRVEIEKDGFKIPE